MDIFSDFFKACFYFVLFLFLFLLPQLLRILEQGDGQLKLVRPYLHRSSPTNHFLTILNSSAKKSVKTLGKFTVMSQPTILKLKVSKTGHASITFRNFLT